MFLFKTGSKHSPVPGEGANNFEPVGSFYVNLMERLAWEDPALRDIVDYYRATEISGRVGGQFSHQWSLSEYSEAVQNQIKKGRPSNAPLNWDEEWYSIITTTR